MHVELRTKNDNSVATTSTGAAGKFRFEHVRTGDYVVGFRWPGWAEQWRPGKTDKYAAGTVTVAANHDTVVNEAALPTGNLVVTVQDEQTGAPVPGALLSSLSSPSLFAKTDSNGKADFGMVRATTYEMSIAPPPDYLYGHISEVVVRPEQTTELTTTLVKESVFSVTFEDASTGAAVKDGCVVIVDSDARGVVDSSRPYCSYGTGKVRIGMYPQGRYRLFAQSGDDAHGSQWVGAQGGTGDLEQAKWFELTPGVTTEVRVRLDGAGSIEGVVTDAATGAAVSELCPSVTPQPYWRSQPLDVLCTYMEGKYKINRLGPYGWRVEFPDYTGKYAWQWSGDKADRFAAEPVRVTAGAARKLDAKLSPAGKVTGKIVGATLPFYYTGVQAVNARTGDWAGPEARVTETFDYTLSGLGSQLIKITFVATPGDPVWYPRPVPVTAGRTHAGVDLHVPASR